LPEEINPQEKLGDMMRNEMMQLEDMVKSSGFIVPCPLCYEKIAVTAAYPHVLHCILNYEAKWGIVHACPKCTSSATPLSPVANSGSTPGESSSQTPKKRKKHRNSTSSSPHLDKVTCDLDATLCDPAHRVPSRKAVFITDAEDHEVQLCRWVHFSSKDCMKPILDMIAERGSIAMTKVEQDAGCEHCADPFPESCGMKLYDRGRTFIYCFCSRKCLLEWVKLTNQTTWETSIFKKKRLEPNFQPSTE